MRKNLIRLFSLDKFFLHYISAYTDRACFSQNKVGPRNLGSSFFSIKKIFLISASRLSSLKWTRSGGIGKDLKQGQVERVVWMVAVIVRAFLSFIRSKDTRHSFLPRIFLWMFYQVRKCLTLGLINEERRVWERRLIGRGWKNFSLALFGDRARCDSSRPLPPDSLNLSIYLSRCSISGEICKTISKERARYFSFSFDLPPFLLFSKDQTRETLYFGRDRVDRRCPKIISTLSYSIENISSNPSKKSFIHEKKKRKKNRETFEKRSEKLDMNKTSNYPNALERFCKQLNWKISGDQQITQVRYL